MFIYKQLNQQSLYYHSLNLIFKNMQKVVSFSLKNLLLIILLQLIEINTSSVLPTTKLLDPYYFGCYYFQFISTSPYWISVAGQTSATSYPYTLTQALPRTFFNVTDVRGILTTFSSSILTKQIGFSIQTVTSGSTINNFNVNLRVRQNCLFNKIGFSIIIVAKPFDQVMKFILFQLFQTGLTYINFTKPTSYDLSSYIVSFDLTTTNTSSFELTRSLSSSANGFCMSYYPATGETVSAVSFLTIIVDKTQRSKMPQFSFLIFQRFNTTILTSNFGISNSIFGTDFDGFCIIGFSDIAHMNVNSPYIGFTMTSSGIVGASQNSVSPYLKIISYCFKDMQCPSTHAYHNPNDTTSCHQCPIGSLIVPTSLNPNLTQTIGLCSQFDPLVFMEQIDRVLGSISRCYMKCIYCPDNHYYPNILCRPCFNVFPHCATCNTNIACLSCIDGYYFTPVASGVCVICTIPSCQICTSATVCIQCFFPAIVIINSCTYCQQIHSNCFSCNITHCLICQLNSYLYQDQCHSLGDIKMTGCLSVIYRNSKLICLTCNKWQMFIFTTNNQQCGCKDGFKINNLTHMCDEICGDAITYNLQCDDGNSDNLDGCTNKCLVSPGFQCHIINSKTVCRSLWPLKLKVNSIIKNSDQNSAVIKLQASSSLWPYNLSTQQFTSVNSNFSFVNVSIAKVPIPITYNLISAQSHYLYLLISYKFTIEELPCVIYINMSQSQYANPQVITLNTFLKGTNSPLIVSSFEQQIKSISISFRIINYLGLLVLIIGLLAKKQIGIQTLLTLQLIYYSQLLIQNAEKWPKGFQYLKYLKYASAYNNLIKISQYLPISSIQRKLYFLQISKTIIQNYNSSFVLLLLCFIIFSIIIIKKKTQQNQIKIIKQKLQKQQCQNLYRQKSPYKSNQLVALKSIQKNQYFQEIAYRLISQISKWSILQIFSAIMAQVFINQKNVIYSITDNTDEVNNINFMFFQQIFNKFILVSTLAIVIWIGSNNFFNIFLSNHTFLKLIKRQQQLNYKIITSIYLIIMGIMIFFLNQITFGPISMSFFVFLLHFGYLILINYKIKPYQKSLKIHRRTLFLNHLIYLVFLAYINLINFVNKMNEIIQIVIGYFLTGVFSIIIVASFFRLYYQYRYGEQLEIQVLKQQQKQKIRDQQQRKYRQKMRIKNYQQEAIKKQLQDPKKRNQFLFQNQMDEPKKQELFFWLSRRFHWTNQEKQKYYFQRFAQKPLEWLKKHKKKRYNEIIQSQINHLKEQNMIKIQKKTFNQLQYEKISLSQLKKKMLGKKQKKQKSKNKK